MIWGLWDSHRQNRFHLELSWIVMNWCGHESWVNVDTETNISSRTYIYAIHLDIYIYIINIYIYIIIIYIYIIHTFHYYIQYIYISIYLYTCTYKIRYYCKSLDTMELSYSCNLIIVKHRICQVLSLPSLFAKRRTYGSLHRRMFTSLCCQAQSPLVQHRNLSGHGQSCRFSGGFIGTGSQSRSISRQR